MDKNNPYASLISVQALQRMPYYLEYLKKLKNGGVETVSAPVIAKHFKLKEIQVRKDFAAVSTIKGKPRAGFVTDELIYNMEELLGCHNVNKAVLAGAGSLGGALLSYGGFAAYGIDIIAAFDIREDLIGKEIGGKKIFHADSLSEICGKLKIRIGIITVPAEQAQTVCDRMIAGGIQAIWNFAPRHLNTPDNILVQNENMASSLALLSNHLIEKLG
ncbi:MAG: redox-sensing transcriptional repressor Rex [Clostridiales bacterium]|jgi:redox-sensing transcriptional repressor|nr:redox-sensing transcriptional repressor Rex [Clostridiales bacterium]